jgi:hypothetical protein
LLPLLHIKLGIIKYFVKAKEQTGLSFSYLNKKFPGMTAANLNEAVFVGPQIRKFFRDEQSDEILSGNQRRAWNDFRRVANKLMRNNKPEFCSEPV